MNQRKLLGKNPHKFFNEAIYDNLLFQQENVEKTNSKSSI